MKELAISEAEWQAEIDRLRCQKNKRIWTKEQEKILLYARDKENPVSWDNLIEYWKKRGWGGIAQNTLKNKYEELHKK